MKVQLLNSLLSWFPWSFPTTRSSSKSHLFPTRHIGTWNIPFIQLSAKINWYHSWNVCLLLDYTACRSWITRKTFGILWKVRLSSAIVDLVTWYHHISVVRWYYHIWVNNFMQFIRHHSSFWGLMIMTLFLCELKTNDTNCNTNLSKILTTPYKVNIFPVLCLKQ